MANEKSIEGVLQVMQSDFGVLDVEVPLYRQAFRRCYPDINVPELTKCNVKSAERRQMGNRLYLERKYELALEKYNESICYAEPGSEHLGVGYANRSAVYFEKREYEYALYNIALARQHNCPERLLPKLQSREARCKEKIDGGQSLGTVPEISYEINVDVNPRIPFLARGITADQSGKRLLAQEDFQAGDVIMVEKPFMVTIGIDLRYKNCNHCGKHNQLSLIPCPTCVKCMYCSVGCLEEDKKYTHRFECAVITQLEQVYSKTTTLGARMFFYGLALFKDDLQAMQKYCNTFNNTPGNPFALDYTENILLKQFKEFHKAKARGNAWSSLLPLTYGTMYYLICMENPLLQSLVANDSIRNFMCRCMLRYSTSMVRLTAGYGPHAHNGGSPLINNIYSFTCLIRHSCDPNVVITYCSDSPRTVVIRPIRRGELIVASQAPLLPKREPRATFHCKCTVCSYASVDDWFKTGLQLPAEARPEAAAILDSLDITNRAQENIASVRDFIQRYAHVHPHKMVDCIINMYRLMVFYAANEENSALNRAAIIGGRD